MDDYFNYVILAVFVLCFIVAYILGRIDGIKAGKESMLANVMEVCKDYRPTDENYGDA